MRKHKTKAVRGYKAPRHIAGRSVGMLKIEFAVCPFRQDGDKYFRNSGLAWFQFVANCGDYCALEAILFDALSKVACGLWDVLTSGWWGRKRAIRQEFDTGVLRQPAC